VHGAPRRFLTTALVTAPDRARSQLPTALATAPFSSDRLSCSAARHSRTRASVPEVIDEVHGLSHAPRMVETVERPPRVPGHDRDVICDNFDTRSRSSGGACEVRVLLGTHAVRQSPAVFRRPQQEGIPIVTSDPSIARYEVEVIW